MNKLSRLTALLLALIMLLSSVSLAEGGLPIGGTSGLTSDDWAALVDAAEDKLFFTDEGDTGKEITPESPEQPEKSDSYPYTDVEALRLTQSDASAEASITASGAAILLHEAAGQWQIDLGGVWANLSGETGEALTVTRAMMNGQNRAEFRKALGDKNAETGEYAAYTQTAVINLIENPPAMFSVSRGASDTAVSDANDGIMTLELANQENMVLVQVVYRIKGTDQPVADAYIGQIAKGSALNTNLTLPRVTGYTASAITGTVAEIPMNSEMLAKCAVFTEPAEDSQGTLQLTVTKELSKEDITIYVEYEPAEVNFTVKHMQQEVDKETYKEVASETMTGLTGAQVGEGHAETYPGFTAIWYDPTTTIAADGSTVVEIHYNREYYLLTFDLGGGYGVEPIFARFGAPVSAGTPLRAGYTFKEWTYEDGTAVGQMPTTMPVGGGRYKAVWEAADTTYTVVYWRADVADGSGVTTYSYWGQKTVEGKSGDLLTPSVVGKEHLAASVGEKGLDEAGYFTYDENITKAFNLQDTQITVAGDGTSVVNVYYSRNVYEIWFIYTREINGKYYYGKTTGCGAYNNTYANGPEIEHTHAKVAWDYNTNTKPVVKTEYADSVDSFSEGGYTYYYIALSAEYGANLESVWPAMPLDKAGSYDFGSWAAQCGSVYREKYGAEHSNIVGAYPIMSADLIVDPTNKIAQKMVAWWANNEGVADHTYHIYYEALPDENADTEFKSWDDVTRQYVRVIDSTFTCAHNGNTRVDPFEYAGFSCVNDTKVFGIETGKDYQQNSKNYSKVGKMNNEKGNQYACPDDKCEYCNVFYYKRNTYTLSFYNYNDDSVKPNEETLMFGESFTSCNPGEPEYPEGVEPGSMRFVGWYTTPECFDGTEVDWENGAMPASDLTFYAKWELVKHDVNFWIDKTGVGSEDAAQKVTSYTDITHGKRITEEKQNAEDYLDPKKYFETNPNSPYKGYDFAGWYYMDGGVEKRFDIKTMPIKTDMDIYAKWTSTTPVEFVFRYMHVDANGNETIELAPPTEGLALPNSPVTMSAKIGSDLTWVPEGNDPLSYIPEVSSHTLDIQVDETKNVFVFKYHMPEKVKYTVQYLAAEEKVVDGKTVLVPIVENGVPKALIKEKTVETEKAVVTENYVPVPEYMPQATQLRLIVSMKEETNVIQFLYVENKEDAPYNVSHYLVDHAGNEYLHTSEMNKTGKIDADVEVNKLKDEDIPGYTFAYAKVAVPELKDGIWEDVLHDVPAELITDTHVMYKLPAAGMHVYLYYEPIKYPVVIQYLDDITEQPLEDADGNEIPFKTVNLPYESIVKTEAHYEEITDYRYVRMDPLEHKVKIEPDLNNPTVNVLKIFYTLDVANIKISKTITESPDDDAQKLTKEQWQTAFPFTVKLTPKAGKSVDKVDVTLPGKERETMTTENGVLSFALKNNESAIIHDLWVGTKYEIKETEDENFKTTYSVTASGTLDSMGVDMTVINTYPKYVGELIIKKDGLTGGESAIVKAVVGSDTYYLVLNATNGYTATISGIKPNTKYEVSEVTDWTWQYDPDVATATGTITEQQATATVTIKNTKKPDKWLHDESHVENDFGAGQSTGVNN